MAEHCRSYNEQSRSNAEHFGCYAGHSGGRRNSITPIKFTSPPSDITEFVDAYHEGEELRFRRLDDIIGGIGPSGLAGRLLNDAELLLISAEEPPTFALAERDGNWRQAMLGEMKAIEENETW